MQSKKPRCHLVLSGGGIRCLSFAGTLEVLEEKIEVASVAACSAGTFIGALLCSRLKPGEIIDKIQKLPSWSALAGAPVSLIPDFFYGLIPGLLFSHYLLQWPFAKYRASGFPRAFKTILKDDPEFKDLEPPLAIAAFDIATQRYLVYAKSTHERMKVSEALDIAVSIPFAYPPRVGKNHIILDAGLASECPVWIAADQPYNEPIIALRPKRKSMLADQLKRVSVDRFYLEVNGSIIRGLDDYIIAKMPRVRLIEIDCGEIDVDQFDLSDSLKHELIERGRKAGKDAIVQYGEDFSRPKEIGRSLFDVTTESDELPGNTKEEEARKYDQRALEHGSELMTRFHQNMSKDAPFRVFISYAREDRDKADYVVAELRRRLLNPNVIWYDRLIEPGEEWKSEILERIDESRLAILLVSRHFLCSSFIQNNEIPRFRKRGVKWIPIIVGKCDWKNFDYIDSIQSLCIDKPLSELPDGKQIEILGHLAETIDSMLRD